VLYNRVGMKTRSGIVVALLILAVLCVYLATITDGMPVQSTDWAMYVMHARNILSGRAYTDTGYIVQPETIYEGANSYPSGLPLLLVPVYAAVGFSVRAFKVVCEVALALSLWPIYLFGRRYLSAAGALLVVLATAFGSLYMGVHDSINSDSVYQLLSFGSIVLALWIYSSGRENWRWGLLVGLAFSAAYLTRPVGFALVLGAIAVDLFRRRRVAGCKWAHICAVAGVFVVLVLVNGAIFHKDSAYQDQFIFSPVPVARHALAYVTYFSYLFASPLGNAFRYAMWVPSMLLAGLGIWAGIRRNGLTLVEFYGTILLGVLCVYWVPNARYLLPLMPIFLVYILMGAVTALARVPQNYRAVLQAAGVVLLLAAPAANLAHIRDGNRDTLIATPAFNQLVQQIEAVTGAHDYVIFWNPRVLALYTGRSSSPYPLAGPAGVQRFVDRVQPQYVVLDKDWEGDRQYLAPAIDSQAQRYVTVFENSQFRLDRVVGVP